jgi:hypothetical protein
MVLVSFDKTHTLKAIITIPNDCYSTMEKQVTSIFDSIKWEKEDPFPNDMAIYYSETGTFYYGLPSSWQLAVDTNVVSAQDSESGSIISVSAVKSETTYEKMTKVDYVSYASSNRTSFSLSSYEADKKTIKAISTYYSGTNSMVLFQYLVASGKYEYAITIEAYSDNYEDANKIFENAIDSFHYYK